jgi:hypothetical protein
VFSPGGPHVDALLSGHPDVVALPVELVRTVAQGAVEDLHRDRHEVRVYDRRKRGWRRRHRPLRVLPHVARLGQDVQPPRARRRPAPLSAGQQLLPDTAEPPRQLGQELQGPGREHPVLPLNTRTDNRRPLVCHLSASRRSQPRRQRPHPRPVRPTRHLSPPPSAGGPASRGDLVRKAVGMDLFSDNPRWIAPSR